MPLVLNDNPRVSLEVRGEILTFEFAASDQLNLDMSNLNVDGFTSGKNGFRKRKTKWFVAAFNRNIDHVEGYAVRAGDRSDPDDLMTLEGWKEHVPDEHKCGAISRLAAKEALDEDDVED